MPSTKRRSKVQIVIAAAVLAAAVGGNAKDDWPRWRGPAGNGISLESAWNAASLTNGIRPLWQINVGVGYSAVSVRGADLYTMGNVDDVDVVYCLNASTGKEVWRYKYPCLKGSYAGTRATPTVDAGHVYTFSREGLVLCLDAKRGARVWKTDIMKDSGVKNIGWGLTSSPIVEGNLLLLNAGDSGVALDKRTGKTVWSSRGKGGYAIPVVYDGGGKRCAVIFGCKSICGVQVSDGAKLWSFPWETEWDVHAADPIVDGGRVFFTSGYDKGCAFLDIAGKEPKVIWQNKLLRCHFSSCVLIDGFLYGIDGNAGSGTLRCVDLEKGTERWSKDLGFGALMAADKKLIVSNEDGSLFVVEASPDAFREIARAEKAVPVEKTARLWTMPVLCRGKLYCRTSSGTLVCFDLSK